MTDAREQPCSPPPMPPALASELDGYRWYRDTIGQSGAAVYRLHAPNDELDLYLKVGRGDDVVAAVTDEMARLRWLTDKLPVPSVRHFTLAQEEAWLLTDAVAGQTAYQLLETGAVPAEVVVDALAGFLRRLHGVAADRCPFNSDYRLRLARAHDRMVAGSVEEDEFDDERQGWTAEQVWAEMTGLLPFEPDPVVTHGDFSLDNLLLVDGIVTGCIDLDRVGIADRYQDLAIGWSCLGEFDPSLQDRFLTKYGIVGPDIRKLRFHLMLDEFF